MEVKEKKTIKIKDEKDIKKCSWKLIDIKKFLMLSNDDLDYILAVIEENIINNCQDGTIFRNGNLNELKGRLALFAYLEHVREENNDEQQKSDQ